MVAVASRCGAEPDFVVEGGEYWDIFNEFEHKSRLACTFAQQVIHSRPDF
jgi:hypothetical protein